MKVAASMINPGSCLSSIMVVEPSKTRGFFQSKQGLKLGNPGIHIYIYRELQAALLEQWVTVNGSLWTLTILDVAEPDIKVYLYNPGNDLRLAFWRSTPDLVTFQNLRYVLLGSNSRYCIPLWRLSSKACSTTRWSLAQWRYKLGEIYFKNVQYIVFGHSQKSSLNF